MTAYALHFINLESSMAYWRYSVKLSAFETFVVAAMIASCDIIFWFWISEKILTGAVKWKILSKFSRWIAKKRDSYTKHQNKRWVKRLKALGHFGLYLFGIIPSLTSFLIGLSIQKLFIQSRYGPWCLWLGAMTRISINAFLGLKAINLLIKLIT